MKKYLIGYEDYYTVEEVAERLKVNDGRGRFRTGASIDLVYRYIRSGRMAFIKHGVYLVHRNEVARFNRNLRKRGRDYERERNKER